MNLDSSLRRLPGLLLGAAALTTGACQSYNDQIQGLVGDYQAAEFGRAAATLDSGELDDALESDTDGLLFQLEAGKVLQDAGRFADSAAMFERASARMERYDLKADVSLSTEFLSAVGTQSSRPYRGTDYDRILLEVYETLNDLALDDFGEAMVHVRRSYRRQAEAVARNAEEIAAREKDGNATGRKAIESPAYKEFEESLESLATDAYSDFVNPMATFLSAVLLREEGTNSNALVDLRKLIGMLPNNSYLPTLLEEFEASSEPVANRFYVIFENGMAPSREEWSLTLPTPNGLSRVAVPTLKVQGAPASSLRVESLDGSLRLETQRVASIDSIVASEFKAHLPSLVWRTVVSQVLKEGSTMVLAHQAEDSIWGALVFWGASIFKVVSADADLRTWRTPGSEFQIAYGQVPKDGRLSLRLGDASGNTVLSLPPARTHFIYVRTPRVPRISPHVFSLEVAAPAKTGAPTP